jgi:hypothetical protein
MHLIGNLKCLDIKMDEHINPTHASSAKGEFPSLIFGFPHMARRARQTTNTVRDHATPNTIRFPKYQGTTEEKEDSDHKCSNSCRNEE